MPDIVFKLIAALIWLTIQLAVLSPFLAAAYALEVYRDKILVLMGYEIENGVNMPV